MKKKIETEESLKAEFNRIKEKLWAIDAKRQTEIGQKKVGKFYKYRNSYSCPQKPSDYWWKYFAPRVANGSSLTGLSFQTDCDGSSSIWANEFHAQHLGGWTEISKPEFTRALKAFQKKIGAVKP